MDRQGNWKEKFFAVPQGKAFGKPSTPQEKLAIETACAFTGYDKPGMSKQAKDHVEIKGDNLRIVTSSGLLEQAEEITARHNDVKAKLSAAGISFTEGEIESDTIATGVSRLEINIPAQENDGFSGVATKMRDHMKSQGELHSKDISQRMKSGEIVRG